MPDETDSDLQREEFIVLFVADRDRGRLRSEEEYCRLYPGAEQVIAREWRRLQDLYGGASTVAGPLPPAPESPPERTWSLDRYRVERELGHGGQGSVFLAWDTTLRRRVALKILKASWSGSETMVRRFALEAQALARLEHPGLAAVHDVGSAHGLEYLAMRYVEGRTLARELAASGSAPARAGVLRYVEIVEKAARALHAAHEGGLIHRDVKPANVMITPDGEPVVLDFGLARFREGPTATLTVTGDVLGTPAFMAPEQIAGDRARIDRRSDVYGLAATLHEAVTGGGREPGAPRGRARRLNPAVPRDLEAVLQAGLDPDPDRRYATAEAFADDLSRIRTGQPVAVRPRSAVRSFLLWCRRAPARAALVLLPPIAVLGGLAAVTVKNREVHAAARIFEASQRKADDEARNATARFADFQRLNDLRRLDELGDRERELWPPHPDRVTAMERWLLDAREVLRRLPRHREALLALRARGRTSVVREIGADPATDRLLHHEGVREAARAELAAGGVAASRRPHLERTLALAERRLPVLEREAASRPAWRFDRVEDQWLHDNLSRLVARLDALAEPSSHEGTIASVERRLLRSRTLETETLVEEAAAWREAVGAIADPAVCPAYGGAKIAPVLGLVPLGRDPASGLWEFAHVLSGTRPRRDGAGRLVISDETGIVLVLVPGGTVRMGARPPFEDDVPGHDHVDPGARANEQPVNEVALDPFFISKWEMTQGQWLRATGVNPSHARPDRAWEGERPTLSCPVEQVSWEDCEDVLGRLGLTLPTEAQWERAARAGTTTPWWPGATIDAFATDENLADRTYFEAEQVATPHDRDRNDGWAGPAPVGSYPPNPFGLCDVIGNVKEWCRDRIAPYGVPSLPGDGLRSSATQDARAVRGGAFSGPSSTARSSGRFGLAPTTRSGVVGVRPALRLEAP
jgi:formylglycine-generating enzyme required for sulfatase activity/predicted Ser/Thr protein kinase